MRPLWANAQAWPTRGDSSLVGAAKLITACLDLGSRCLAVVCLVGMFGALLTNVVLRYAFGTGIAWAYEIHSVLLPWLVAGGVVVASAHGQQIVITLVHDMIGERMSKWLLLCVQIAIVAISASVLWTSPPIMGAAQFQRLSTLGITQVWGYASLLYAFAGMGIIALLDALRLLSGEPLVSNSSTVQPPQ